MKYSITLLGKLLCVLTCSFHLATPMLSQIKLEDNVCSVFSNPEEDSNTLFIIHDNKNKSFDIDTWDVANNSLIDSFDNCHFTEDQAFVYNNKHVCFAPTLSSLILWSKDKKDDNFYAQTNTLCLVLDPLDNSTVNLYAHTLTSKGCLEKLEHKAPVCGADFFCDGKMVVTASVDRFINFWKLPEKLFEFIKENRKLKVEEYVDEDDEIEIFEEIKKEIKPEKIEKIIEKSDKTLFELFQKSCSGFPQKTLKPIELVANYIEKISEKSQQDQLAFLIALTHERVGFGDRIPKENLLDDKLFAAFLLASFGIGLKI